MRIAQSSLKNTCVQFPALKYFSSRKQIAERMLDDLRVEFAKVYATVELLQLRGISLSTSFENQLTQNVIAVQDQVKAELMKQVSIIQANTNVILAKAQANITQLIGQARWQARAARHARVSFAHTVSRRPTLTPVSSRNARAPTATS